METVAVCAVCDERPAGRASMCSRCYQRQPHIRAYKAAHSAANPPTPEQRAHRVASTRAWRVRQSGTAAHAARVARAQAAVGAWRRANPESHNEASRLDRLRRKVGRDPEAVPYIAAVACDPCAYCGGPADTLDHIVPVSRGGTNVWYNLTAACRPCNSRKQAVPLLLALLRG